MPYKDPEARRAYHRERQRAWRAKNPEKVRAQARDLRRRDPERHRQAKARYKARHPERYKEITRKGAMRKLDRMREDPRYWLQQHFFIAKQGARRRNIVFAITQEDWMKMATPAKCPVLGCELVYCARGRRQEFSASIDRRNSATGYVNGNVRVICWRANRLRSDATAAELKIVAEDTQWQEAMAA